MIESMKSEVRVDVVGRPSLDELVGLFADLVVDYPTGIIKYITLGTGQDPYFNVTLEFDGH